MARGVHVRARSSIAKGQQGRRRPCHPALYGGRFRQLDRALLQTFATQCVLAIENARLFRDAERERTAAETALVDLRRAQDRLIQTEKLASLGQLTAGIAHEIKNPLNFVNNFAELSVDLLDELDDALRQGLPCNLARRSPSLAREQSGTDRPARPTGRQHRQEYAAHSAPAAGERTFGRSERVVVETLNLAYHGARAETPGFNITLRTAPRPGASARSSSTRTTSPGFC